jgi:hypothetical protein
MWEKGTWLMAASLGPEASELSLQRPVVSGSESSKVGLDGPCRATLPHPTTVNEHAHMSLISYCIIMLSA